jgi:hypothetical protein
VSTFADDRGESNGPLWFFSAAAASREKQQASDLICLATRTLFEPLFGPILIRR